jgi:hypothetical protein
MATSLQSRGFQSYTSYNNKTRPLLLKKSPRRSADEHLTFGRIPYSSLRISMGAVSASSSSPSGLMKPRSMTTKRRSSTMNITHLLSRRRSLQTTAIASRRQSLWMSIAKNAPPTSEPPPSMLLLRQDHTSLMRKKILRLLLVFSYLLSISLLAIALATFYGFFWSGYSRQQTTSISDIKPTVRSLVSLVSNSTSVDSESEIEDVS